MSIWSSCVNENREGLVQLYAERDLILRNTYKYAQVNEISEKKDTFRVCAYQ